ncbi:MAG: amino acid ABC transporter substrate-binding protein, partial [Piscinibacter sp.]
MHKFALSLIATTAAACALPLAAQAQSTLDKVKSSGAITVAYRESSIPFSYLVDKAQPIGFGWEICGKIVDEVKKATGRADLKVNTQAVTSANR